MLSEVHENTLYPIFLKLNTLRLLVVGGGKVALEKLHSVLSNSPKVEIVLVAKEVSKEIKDIALQYSNILIKEKEFEEEDLQNINTAIVAVNDIALATQIRSLAQQYNILVNVADKPELCDFYLGSIVQKGNLKIAISTNGKSPTISKRLKETLNEVIPNSIDVTLHNMHEVRKHLKGNFEHKVKVLNQLTTDFLISEKELEDKDGQVKNLNKILKNVQLRANIYLGIIGVLVLVGLFSLLVVEFQLWPQITDFLNRDNHIFYWMLGVGFFAEIVAGSMGMGYGVICTSILLVLNIPPAMVSASIHSAESFTTAAGGYSHYKLKNVNKKLVWRLLPAAIIGALVGALLLSYLGEHYAGIVKPIISLYTLYLGWNILKKVFKPSAKKGHHNKEIRYTPLSFIGGFIDSFGGGGWGPLVTGTLIKSGKSPRLSVGSSTVVKFCLTVTSAITFIFTLGTHHWNIILGLLLGGVFTAPFSAMITSKLPSQKMLAIVGVFVVFLSLFSFVRAVFY
ncbi:TSUP family transporter [Elizabethkingia sp. JS20170427COW]|uniref:TSUP family transporter n=1 Tax=Elizabethkingia sp. JS20170427COW TaxID=2583851 RepID=UPI0011106DDB|nr:TSUP family transporter [Elizabethkingia sp. JS20170427COW]QCX53571.1 ABC transporter permease [Elizabethkingia sp. JS20170427COW]